MIRLRTVQSYIAANDNLYDEWLDNPDKQLGERMMSNVSSAKAIKSSEHSRNLDLQQAVGLYIQGDSDAALATVERLLKRDKYTNLLLSKAFLLLDKKRTREAHIEYQFAGKSDPTPGVLQNAENFLQTAYELTKNPELLYGLAQISDLKGDRSSAISAYRQYLESAAHNDEQPSKGMVNIVKRRLARLGSLSTFE